MLGGMQGESPINVMSHRSFRSRGLVETGLEIFIRLDIIIWYGGENVPGILYPIQLLECVNNGSNWGA